MKDQKRIKKGRNERIEKKDIGTTVRVHNGLKRVECQVKEGGKILAGWRNDEENVKLRWGDRVKTRKPCRKGAAGKKKARKK